MTLNNKVFESLSHEELLEALHKLYNKLKN